MLDNRMTIPSHYINLGTIAKSANKKTTDWTRQDPGKSQIAQFERNRPEIARPLIKLRGRNGGTWAHPELAAIFAAWCRVEFAGYQQQYIRVLESKAETDREGLSEKSELLFRNYMHETVMGFGFVGKSKVGSKTLYNESPHEFYARNKMESYYATTPLEDLARANAENLVKHGMWDMCVTNVEIESSGSMPFLSQKEKEWLSILFTEQIYLADPDKWMADISKGRQKCIEKGWAIEKMGFGINYVYNREFSKLSESQKSKLLVSNSN